jgi:hypothetical protein
VHNEDTTGMNQEVNDDGNVLSQEMDERYGERSGRYNMRGQKAPDYSHLKTFSKAHTTVGVNGESASPVDGSGESLATAQMNMKKGLRMFGEDGVNAVPVEMHQLH